MRKSYILLLIVMFKPGISAAQWYKEATPLASFFRNNYDSTFILNTRSAARPYPDLYIVAKKDGKAYYFRYNYPNAGMESREVPGLSCWTFVRVHGYGKVLPDTNQYFSIVRTGKDDLWRVLKLSACWNISDLRKPPANCHVDDGGSLGLTFITSSAIEKRVFYGVHYYAGCDTLNKEPKIVEDLYRTMIDWFSQNRLEQLHYGGPAIIYTRGKCGVMD